MNNYDSTLPGVEYIRIPRIVIEYPNPLTARVVAVESPSVKMQDGSVRVFPGERDISWNISMLELDHSFPLVNPESGATITDAEGNPVTMTYQQIMLGLLGAIRQKQIERDTPAVVVAPEGE